MARVIRRRGSVTSSMATCHHPTQSPFRHRARRKDVAEALEGLPPKKQFVPAPSDSLGGRVGPVEDAPMKPATEPAGLLNCTFARVCRETRRTPARSPRRRSRPRTARPRCGARSSRARVVIREGDDLPGRGPQSRGASDRHPVTLDTRKRPAQSRAVTYRYRSDPPRGRKPPQRKPRPPTEGPGARGRE